METREVAEQINDLVEEAEAERAQLDQARAEMAAEREERAREREASHRRERFRQRAALVISALATLLAITSVGAGNATEDIISKNIEASDTWNFYQAKNIRQTEYRIGAEVLDALVAGGAINEAARPGVQSRSADFRATVDRYENEPNEGKQDLSKKAQHLEEERDRARKQDNSFDLAEAMFQIAIVLGSVAIIATSRPVLAIAVAFGLAATVFMLNGFFLLFPLPWS